MLDLQECPAAELAIAAAVCAVVKAHVDEKWCDTETQQRTCGSIRRYDNVSYPLIESLISGADDRS